MTQRWNVARWIVVFSLVAGIFAGVAEAQQKQTVQLQIEGSTTVGPIADAFKEAVEAEYKHIKITVKKTGSGDGAAALVDGKCHIATMSREMKLSESQNAVKGGIQPFGHVVAMDGVCVIVHPSNPVSALTGDQLRDIYTGKITNWNQLGGPDKKIIVISRDTSSGTFETFNKLVMKKKQVTGKAEYVNSNPQAQLRVSTTEGAVAYVGLGFAQGKVKPLMIDNVRPTKRTIASGVYPISRPLFLYTNGYPKLGSPEHIFCTLHLTEKGQEIVELKGFVPVTNY